MNIFDKALQIIQERGMCKNELMDSKGHVCVYGALNIAGNDDAIHMYWGEESQHMDRVAKELFPLRGSVSAAQINNHPYTTQEDVELILKHSSYEWDLLHPEVA